MSRKILMPLTALVAALAMLLTMFASIASAQYPTIPPPVPAPAGPSVPVDDLVDTIDVQQEVIPAAGNVTPNADGTVSADLDLSGIFANRNVIDRMVVEYNPVIYDGPVVSLLSIDIPPCVDEVTVTIYFKAGGTSVKNVPIPGNTCDGGQAIAIPVPGGNAQLAFTGNEVSVPAATGAALIGAGGLLLLAANKRSRKEA